jgi:cinnamoyl-CoA:phenyllactate CoA-transferase
MLDHPVYARIQTLAAQGKSSEMYDLVWEIMLTRTAAEWADIFTRADIPFSVAQTWEEVVEDKQAWATDVFTKTKFSSGAERVVVRPPVIMEETPLPAYREYPLVGADNAAVLAELGYSREQIRDLEANKDVIAWKLDEKGNPLK